MSAQQDPPSRPDDPQDTPPLSGATVSFLERFAASLIDLGFPRMPARVFAALLTSSSGRLTAAEISELLGISPASVSGAVRYLSRVGLISRERVPGSRRDHYVLFDDVWYTAIVTKDRRLHRLSEHLRTGVELFGPDSPTGRRLTETLTFFDFVDHDLSLMLERWQALRSRSDSGQPATRPTDLD